MFVRWWFKALEGPVRDGTKDPRGDQRLAQHDQFKRFDQNLRGTGCGTEAVHASLMSQPHEVEVKPIRQGDDPSFRRLLFYPPNHLKQVTDALTGFDKNKGRPRRHILDLS